MFHCSFGANFAGPTRFMTSLPYHGELKLKLGSTQLDTEANYAGPLPAWCGHRHDKRHGKDKQGKFLSKHKATYSMKLCEAVTVLCFKLRQRDPFGVGFSGPATWDALTRQTLEDDSATDTDGASDCTERTHKLQKSVQETGG